MGIDENEIEEFIKNDLDKVIDQTDKVDESVEEHLNEMGWLWARLREKLEKDKTCFRCKKHVEFSTDNPVNVVEATKVESGVIAFISICKDCHDTILDEKMKSEKK